MVKQSFFNFKNTKDYKNLILTLLITIFVLSMNLNVNKNLKLIFLLLSLGICIYDLNYLIPFIVSFLIVTSYNYKFLNNKKEIKEHFNSDDKKLEKLISDIKKIPFFRSETNEKLTSFYKKYRPRGDNPRGTTPKDIYQALNLEGIYTDSLRNIELLDSKEFKKKMALLFTQSPNRQFSNFMYDMANQLGFLHIYDGTFDDEEKIETLKLSLSEVILSIFEEHVKKYNSENGKNELDINSIVDDDFDFSTNRNKNYEVLNFDFEIEDYTDLLKNDDFKANISYILNFEFKENISSGDKKISLGLDGTIKTGVTDSIEILNDYESEIQNITDKLNLFNNSLRRIRDETDRRINELKLFKNLYTFLIFENKGLQKHIEDIDFTEISNNLQEIVDNHPEPNKFINLNPKDIFFNSLLYYLKINEIGDDLYIEELLDIYEAPEESPPPVGEEYKEDPLWYSDSELKKSFGINEMNNKNEEELEKYYRAMEFNSPNLKEISKHAEAYNEKIKIEKVSFDNKIDTFSVSIFGIIDDLNDLIQEIFYNNSPSSSSPSPTSSDLKGFDYYIYIIRRIIDIITQEDRVLHMGFVFIIIALFVYFVDVTDSNNNFNQHGGFVSVMDYLNKVRI